MQCEFCRYEFTMKEVQASAPCPRCAERRQAMEARKAADAAIAPHVRSIINEHRGAQPVVIVDVHMTFNSMVWFMVKWVLASIPAMIILVVLGFLFVLFFGGMAGLGAR